MANRLIGIHQVFRDPMSSHFLSISIAIAISISIIPTSPFGRRWELLIITMFRGMVRRIIRTRLFMGRDKILDGDAGLFNGAPEGSRSKGFMEGNHAAFIVFTKNNMAVFLSDLSEPHSLKGPYGLFAGDSRQLRHEPEPQRWSE
jgi:hypothetical protein